MVVSTLSALGRGLFCVSTLIAHGTFILWSRSRCFESKNVSLLPFQEAHVKSPDDTVVCEHLPRARNVITRTRTSVRLARGDSGERAFFVVDRTLRCGNGTDRQRGSNAFGRLPTNEVRRDWHDERAFAD